jgi:hypothetical protein
MWSSSDALKLMLKTSAILSTNTIPNFTLSYVPIYCCVFIVLGDSSCVSWSAVFSINFEAPDDDHIGRDI